MMILREDRLESVAAFAIGTSGSQTKPNTRDRGTCGHCDKFGHDEPGCFELIGYPPSWNSRSRGRGRGLRGNRGGRQGGLRGRGDGREGAHTVAANSSVLVEPFSEVVKTNATSQSVIPGLTTEQIQRLMSLIDPTKAENDKLDSRASAHMTGDLTLLFEIKATAPVMIDLPNRAQTSSKK